MVIKADYLVSKQIPVGDFFGAEPGDATIELRETSVQNLAKFQNLEKDGGRAADLFLELLPNLIVNHDLYKDEVNKYTAAEVTNMAASRAEFGLYLMNQYMSEVVFTHGKKIGGK